MRKYITSSRLKIGNDKNHLPILILSSEEVGGAKALGCKSLWQYSVDNCFYEHHIASFEKFYNNHSLYTSVGYQGDKFLRRFPNAKVIENPNYQEFNECEDIRLFLNAVQPEHFLTILGNYSIEFDISKIKHNQSTTFYSNTNAKDLGILKNGNELSEINFNYDNHWSGLIYFGAAETLKLKKNLKTKDYSHYYLFEVINLLIKQDVKITINENTDIKR
jgi:hypothetical protein